MIRSLFQPLFLFQNKEDSLCEMKNSSESSGQKTDLGSFKFSGVHQFISSSVQSSFLNTDNDTDTDTDTDTEIILKLFKRINLIDYLIGRNTEGEQEQTGDENK